MKLTLCAGCFPYSNAAGKYIPQAIVHMKGRGEGERKTGEEEQMSDTSPRGWGGGAGGGVVLEDDGLVVLVWTCCCSKFKDVQPKVTETTQGYSLPSLPAMKKLSGAK